MTAESRRSREIDTSSCRGKEDCRELSPARLRVPGNDEDVEAIFEISMSFPHTSKKGGRAWPFLLTLIASFLPYCSRERTACGSCLAWARIAVPACCSTWFFDRLAVSEA
ncbi:hypothetical protein D3C76_1459310 [compost metagenome]